MSHLKNLKGGFHLSDPKTRVASEYQRYIFESYVMAVDGVDFDRCVEECRFSHRIVDTGSYLNRAFTVVFPQLQTVLPILEALPIHEADEVETALILRAADIWLDWCDRLKPNSDSNDQYLHITLQARAMRDSIEAIRAKYK